MYDLVEASRERVAENIDIQELRMFAILKAAQSNNDLADKLTDACIRQAEKDGCFNGS